MDFVNESYLSEKNGCAAIVSTKDWLKFMCLGFLNFIPLVGTLIYLGILIYLAVRTGTAESVSSYIKASLIFSGIVLGVTILLYIVLFGGFIYLTNSI